MVNLPVSAVNGVDAGEEAEVLARCRQPAATLLGFSQTQAASAGCQGDQQPADDRSSQLHLAAEVS